MEMRNVFLEASHAKATLTSAKRVKRRHLIHAWTRAEEISERRKEAAKHLSEMVSQQLNVFHGCLLLKYLVYLDEQRTDHGAAGNCIHHVCHTLFNIILYYYIIYIYYNIYIFILFYIILLMSVGYVS